MNLLIYRGDKFCFLDYTIMYIRLEEAIVCYKEGAEMYSMGMNKFQALAKDARAVLKIDRMVLVDLDIFDEYLETFRV